VKFARRGDQVKFVSMTDGRSGHHDQFGPALAVRRRQESDEAGRRLGVAAYDILDNPDGALMPDLENRIEVVRQIRAWRADVVITHRPNDYHADHRYTSQVVQDSAYLVLVPNVCPDTPVLRQNPVYLYMEDSFAKPVPFSPDVVVDISDIWDRKIDALDAHVSQFYEWLPWVDGTLDQVPSDPADRRAWFERQVRLPLGPSVRAALERRYGQEVAGRAIAAEAFELCEYGRSVTQAELNELFPL
jgi:LmbE family N-acetylglucosaminyl deacetylase